MIGPNLSAISIRRPSLMLYFMLVALIAGSLAFVRLGRNEDPAFTIRTMVVGAAWPGATTEETLLQVTERLERTLQEVKWLDRLRSYANAGQTTIFVDLKQETPASAVPDMGYDVRKRIGDMAHTLPAGVQGPFFNDDFGDTFGIIFGFTADGFSHRELRDFVEASRSRLLRVPDVTRIEVLGAQDEPIFLEISTERLAAGDPMDRAATFAHGALAAPMLTGTLVTIAGFVPIGFARSAAGEYTFSIFAAEDAARRLDAALAADPDVARWSTYVGRGAIRFSLPLNVQLANPFFSQTMVVAKDVDARNRLQAKLDRLLAEEFPEAIGRASPLELGPPEGWPIQYRVSGPDVEQVRRIALRVAEVVAGSSGTRLVNFDWMEPQRQVRVRIDEDQARQLGVSAASLAAVLNTKVAGQTVTQVRDDIYLVGVVLRATESERAALDTLANLQVPIPGGPEPRASLAFWTLLLALWGALAAAFVGGDLFNLFVALEMLAFAALALACLDGRPSQFTAELRYLLFAILGSVLYLLGCALLYGSYGTLDVVLLSSVTRADAPTAVAAALMTAGLLAKTALLPLHLWLPPAHAGAPPAASALLSAVVVKAAFLLLLRLWFGALAGIAFVGGAQLLALLGAAAILIGSVLALAQTRLKMLVACSTAAKIGYLFVMLPLVGADPFAGTWTGGMLQAIAHAQAKAAMYLSVGLLAEAMGDDRIDSLAGMVRAAPRGVLAFALGGMTLMGLPPSGGFTAKWLLLQTSIAAGQWWWSLVILVGGLLTGSYVYRVVQSALRDAPAGGAARPPIPQDRQNAALLLGVMSFVLGLLPLASFDLLQIGRLDLVDAR